MVDMKVLLNTALDFYLDPEPLKQELATLGYHFYSIQSTG